MSAPGTGSIRCAVTIDGRVELVSRPRPTLGTAGGSVLVRPTMALLTPLEREVARGLGSPAAGVRVLGTSCVGVVEDASQSGGLVAKGARVAVQPVFACGRCERLRVAPAAPARLRIELGGRAREVAALAHKERPVACAANERRSDRKRPLHVAARTVAAVKVARGAHPSQVAYISGEAGEERTSRRS
jgi:hypothetical protein